MAEETYLDESALARLRQLGGDEFVKRVVGLFLASAPERIAAVQAGLQAGDLEAVERAAQSLKSSAGNLGASRLQELAGRIEQLAEDEQAGAIPPLLGRLEGAFGLVRAALEGQQRPEG